MAEPEDAIDALQQISHWCHAYPQTVFTEPDLDKMREVLAAAGMPTALDAAHGTWARHLLTGIADIADKALGGPNDRS
jgi:hypothetical protein